MAVRQDAVLRALEGASARFDEALDGLTDAEWGRFVPYGRYLPHDAHWRIADVVDHTAGLYTRLRDIAETVAAGGAGLEELRASLVESTANLEAGRSAPAQETNQAPAALRDALTRRFQELVETVRRIPEDTLAVSLPPTVAGAATLGQRLWEAGSGHVRLHAADVERARYQEFVPEPRTVIPEMAQTAARLSYRAELTATVAFDVPDNRWPEPSLNFGWTYHDLLAHLATGDWVLQEHLRSLIAHGRRADWSDIHAGNKERIGERQDRGPAELIEEMLEHRAETLRLLSQLRPELIRLPFHIWWDTNEGTIGDYIAGHYQHSDLHTAQLRRALPYVEAVIPSGRR